MIQQQIKAEFYTQTEALDLSLLAAIRVSLIAKICELISERVAKSFSLLMCE